MSSNHSCCVFGDAAKQNAVEVACSECGLDPMCVVLDYAEADSGVPEGILLRRQQVEAGQTLFESGQHFDAIYAVKSGSFKALMLDPQTGERVVGFYFAGELVGAEGMADQRYDVSVRALEVSQVCVLHLDRLDEASRPQQAIQRALIDMLSREVALNQRMTAALVRQNADQRLAAFLLSLSERLSSRGFASDEFNLRMSRSDIGSYLGLARETVSRLLTRFQKQGLIRLRGRQLQLQDVASLRLVAYSD
ncbi:MAG: helix-turn-helix domain-containing protein [Candidatus Thiodiazotropha sp.]|jgi:CRP/FNR family transcriptional regulator, anaerobic regulatory protein